MPTLREVLEKREEIIKTAKELGFEQVRLLKSATPGYFVIYGTFSQDCPKDSYNRRCLALTYKLSELVKGKAGVVSNEADPDGSILKTTLSLDEQDLSAFERIFSANPEEVIIEEGEEFSYKSKMRLYKVHYEQLTLNEDQDQKLEKEKTSQSSPLPPVIIKLSEKTITPPSSSSKHEPKAVEERVKRKLSEIPKDITEYLSTCSEEEFAEAIENLKKIRSLHQSSLHQQKLIIS